jgi:hypothetical protein
MPLSTWPSHPFIYELNTWVWLESLSQQFGKLIQLDSVPDSVWDGIADLGFNAVWLMGVWERSPAGIAVTNRNEGLLNDFRRALPDFSPQDNVGSPYCVRRYVVDDHLGGPAGLGKARGELQKRGIRLLLDYVPNHVAPDHPWATEHPEYMIRGDAADLKRDPGSFLQIDDNVIACGRDPFFPAWPDVIQLNAFNPDLRLAAIATLRNISAQCDGVRCDMAMLLLNDVFQRTWAWRAGPAPAQDFWKEVIPAVKSANPNFQFIAEAYWDLEWELQQQGFDHCYDKRLYDRMEHEPAMSSRMHLCAEMEFQKKLVRFLENHDEPRAAATFSDQKQRAAAVIISTTPGAKLFHEGQFEGRKVRLPVFLARRPDEPVNEELKKFYQELLPLCASPTFHEGAWRLCETTGWPGNASHENLIAYTWELQESRYLIIVNFSPDQVHARVRTPWDDLDGQIWVLHDPLHKQSFERSGSEIDAEGLYVELGEWEWHFFELRQLGLAGTEEPDSLS